MVEAHFACMSLTRWERSIRDGFTWNSLIVAEGGLNSEWENPCSGPRMTEESCDPWSPGRRHERARRGARRGAGGTARHGSHGGHVPELQVVAPALSCASGPGSGPVT